VQPGIVGESFGGVGRYSPAKRRASVGKAVQTFLPAGCEGVDVSLKTTSVVAEPPTLRNLTAEERNRWFRYHFPRAQVLREVSLSLLNGQWAASMLY